MSIIFWVVLYSKKFAIPLQLFIIFDKNKCEQLILLFKLKYFKYVQNSKLFLPLNKSIKIFFSIYSKLIIEYCTWVVSVLSLSLFINSRISILLFFILNSYGSWTICSSGPKSIKDSCENIYSKLHKNF